MSVDGKRVAVVGLLQGTGVTMAKKTKRKTGVAHDIEVAGALCLAFVNTAAPRRDDRRHKPQVPSVTRLESYSDLVGWVQRMGALGAAEGDALHRAAAERPAEGAAVLKRALLLRAAGLRTFTALAVTKEPQAQDLEILSDALRARRIVPGPDGFRRDWGEPEALDRVLWPLAQSAAELLCSDSHRKIRQCATKGCSRLFVYGNRRRLWCDPNTCGSRARGRRHNELVRKAKAYNSSLSPAQRAALDQRDREATLKRIQAKEDLLAKLNQASKLSEAADEAAKPVIERYSPKR